MRQAVAAPARPKATIVTLPVAVRGLVESRPSADPDMRSAAVLENWVPTQRGVRIRGGSPKVATIGEAVTSMFTYKSSSLERSFAASATAVYDITSLAAETVPAKSIANQTAGYYSTQMMGTSGGEFLVIANGSNYLWYFDGTNFNPITSVAVSDLNYDGLSTDFAAGETVTGGTSGATATVLAVTPATSTTGVLKVGTITSGPFQDNEAITSAGGAATANGASALASSVTITGVATTALSAPWHFGNRLFLVEQGTQSAWYLPVDSIGGAASELSFAGVFKRGGSLLFGGAWSLDSGDGFDDKCVFVSSEGEVAVYTGYDPDSAWSLEGRYDISKPLGVNGKMQAGGDLLIATEDGIVPLSQVVQKDPAALSLAAVTRDIEKLWAFEVSRNLGSIELLKWSDNNLGLVVLPSADRALIVNLQTGGWGVATNWGMNCATTFNSRALGGFSDGSIRALDEGGADNGEAFTAKYCHAFSGMGNQTAYKQAQMVRPAFYASAQFTYSAGFAFDYNASFDPAPLPATLPTDYLVWGQGKWGQKRWYSAEFASLNAGFSSNWTSVAGGGFTMAPTVQITSNGSSKLEIELVQIDMSFEVGGAIV